MLYIIENQPIYDDWKDKVVRRVTTIIKEQGWKKRTDAVCLFLDMIVCPYLSRDQKVELMVAAGICKTTEAANSKLSEQKRKGIDRWFWDWDKNRDFGKVLMKKAYHPAYG